MSTKVAINGFGRIGRNFMRAAHEHDADLEIVAVNDVTDAATLAQLLAFDSVYGRFPEPVRAEDGAISVNGRSVKVLAERDPSALPWSELGVEVVIESTGIFRTRAAAAKHLDAGAHKVIVTAPDLRARSPQDANVVLGVNFGTVYDAERHHIVTNASCTTDCLAPVATRAARRGRDSPRADDHDPRLHIGSEPPRRAAQGSAPRTGSGDQPGPNVDGRRKSARSRHP